MRLKDIMTHTPKIVSPDCSVADAARQMGSLDVGFLPVGDEAKMVGVITDRDITIRCVAEGKDPAAQCVREVMTESVECLPQDASVEDASHLMETQQIRRIVVTDKAGRCVGVVSLGDLAVKTGDERLSGETLEEVSEPSRAAR